GPPGPTTHDSRGGRVRQCRAFCLEGRMPGDFDGKIVAVAGGSTGIGRAAALKIARQGGTLAIAARGVEALENTAADIRGLGAQCITRQADFAVRGTAEDFIGATVAEYGGLDVLINVVGGG